MRSVAMPFAIVFSTLSLLVNGQIDPNSVPIGTRDVWCSSQITQCPLICTQQTSAESAGTEANTCDPTSLAYSCVCSDGTTPNASEYSQTIPYFLCTQTNTNCVANCGLNNNVCAAACTQNHPCGAQNPTRVNSSTISTMSATSTASGQGSASAVSTASGGSAVYTGFGGATTSSAAGAAATGKSAATTIVVNVGRVYGFAAVAAGIFAGFTLLL